ncbi:MAG: hypothetical protein II062_03160 [Oscillospiraceae bacterium]|nr:hypothetical protein [Oscillospiraceae bacterium]
MDQQELNKENPEQQAPEQQENRETPYVERPRSQRILAWALAGVVALGVVLYLCWIAGILK